MYIEREIVGLIEEYLTKPEIIAVIGPRQAGKTTLVINLIKGLPNVNQITFDDIKARTLFEEDIDTFIDYHVKPFKLIFIDEIQYARDSGQKLKYIFDTQNTKIIISGSSTVDIVVKSLRYLVGRIIIFPLFQFSFIEYLRAKNPRLIPIYEKKEYGNEMISQLNGLLKDFITYGGYPRVVLAETVEEKKVYLKNILNTLLLRDVNDLFKIMENDKLLNLVKALALQIGNLINYTELCDITGLKQEKLKKYIYALEELYICKRCGTFSKNPRTEIVKTPKIYFYDYGLRNIVIDNFENNRSDLGAIYENLIFVEWLKKDKELKYWRTKSGGEVDFVLKNEPIEIKTIPKTSRSLFSFIKKYEPQNAYIISSEEKETIEKEGCKIHFIPFPKFI